MIQACFGGGEEEGEYFYLFILTLIFLSLSDF